MAVVQVEVEPTAGETGHRREVENPFGTGDGLRWYSFGKIEFPEREVRLPPIDGEISLLDRARIIGSEAVNSRDRVPICQ
jgi:hypothetical protein